MPKPCAVDSLMTAIDQGRSSSVLAGRDAFGGVQARRGSPCAASDAVPDRIEEEAGGEIGDEELPREALTGKTKSGETVKQPGRATKIYDV